jgi:hypothetical protein
MARTAAKPVAGQPGYQAIEINNHRELMPQEVIPQRKERPVAALKKGRDASAADLIAHLFSTGTPKGNGMSDGPLDYALDWLHKQADDTTAAEMFEYLDSAENYGHPKINIGTLKKAGRWLYEDDTWTPEEAMLATPTEEIKRLRQENAILQSQLNGKNLETVSLKHQVTHLMSRVDEMSKQTEYLKARSTPEDLQAAGVAGKNVTID